jgi:hypothetical protein
MGLPTLRWRVFGEKRAVHRRTTRKDALGFDGMRQFFVHKNQLHQWRASYPPEVTRLICGANITWVFQLRGMTR